MKLKKRANVLIIFNIYFYFAVPYTNVGRAAVGEGEDGTLGGGAVAGKVGVEGVVEGEDADGPGVEDAALIGEGKGVVAALDEGAANLLFGLGDALADRRLARPRIFSVACRSFAVCGGGFLQVESLGKDADGVIYGNAGAHLYLPLAGLALAGYIVGGHGGDIVEQGLADSL